MSTPFVERLRRLVRELEEVADLAERRDLTGLAGAMTLAKCSARSWADQLDHREARP